MSSPPPSPPPSSVPSFLRCEVIIVLKLRREKWQARSIGVGRHSCNVIPSARRAGGRGRLSVPLPDMISIYRGHIQHAVWLGLLRLPRPRPQRARGHCSGGQVDGDDDNDDNDDRATDGKTVWFLPRNRRDGRGGTDADGGAAKTDRPPFHLPPSIIRRPPLPSSPLPSFIPPFSAESRFAFRHHHRRRRRRRRRRRHHLHVGGKIH